MKRILHIVHHEFHPIVSSEAWVDDVNQRSQRTREMVVEQTSRAGIMFGKGVEALGLTIADKSRCIANQPGVAEEIVMIVNASGLPVRAADVSPDLGIDRGRRVATRKPTHKKRWQAAAAKTLRIVKLARSAKRWRVGKRLFCASAIPQAGYSSKVYGLPPSRVQDLRRAAGAVLSLAKKGRCLTTRLALDLGPADPGVSLRVDLIKSWLDFVVNFPGDFSASWNFGLPFMRR